MQEALTPLNAKEEVAGDTVCSEIALRFWILEILHPSSLRRTVSVFKSLQPVLFFAQQQSQDHRNLLFGVTMGTGILIPILACYQHKVKI